MALQIITPRMMIAAGVSKEAATVWVYSLNAACEEFEINSTARAVPFLANMAHESSGFTRMVENLNYSGKRLLELWPCTPKRLWGFTEEEARRYANRPEKIANRVYGKRFGNGPESSGDGWRYRGRGPLQLTFKNNYQSYGDELGVDLVADPDAAMGMILGSRIAGRYWYTHDCNEMADVMDDEGIRRAINGGTNGLEEVQQKIRDIEAVLED